MNKTMREERLDECVTHARTHQLAHSNVQKRSQADCSRTLNSSRLSLPVSTCLGRANAQRRNTHKGAKAIQRRSSWRWR